MSNFLIDEDTDLLAAEFVLGTLDSEERANAQSLLRTDHGFIAMVRIWERRFGELHLMVEPVEPDAGILQRIKAKIAELPPREPVPDGKPPAGMTPGPMPPEAPGAPANVEMPKPVEGLAAGDAPDLQKVPADGTAVPAEVSVTGDLEKAAQTPPAPEAVPVVPGATEGPTAAEAQLGAEPKSPEAAENAEGEPAAKVAVPAPSPPPPPLKPADKSSEVPPAGRRSRRPENPVDVIRSRGRWRAVGIAMTLLVLGFVALLAAWRFVPDRLPAALRPAQLMTSVGIEALPKAAPAVKPARPVAQFDE